MFCDFLILTSVSFFFSVGTSFLNSHLPKFLSKKLEVCNIEVSLWQGAAQKTKVWKNREKLLRETGLSLINNRTFC